MGIFRRQPDFVIGDPANPYLLRWWIIPRNRFFNIYLHKIMRSDDDRALHDHPWTNVSIVLKGGYLEWRSHAWEERVNCAWRGPGSIVFRKPLVAHRLSLGHEGNPCWSPFITGPRRREWGFHCPGGRWIDWRAFTAPADRGQIGRGCD
jgi:hypothetical protein